MIVAFYCDFCGAKVARPDVTSLLLIEGAFLSGSDRQKTQLELCPQCADGIRRTKRTEVRKASE